MTVLSKTERRRFYRFAIVGTIGAAIDFSVFNLLIQLAGFRPVLANVFSFSAAVISNFIWNRFWTYPDSRSKRIRRQLAEFFTVNLIGVLIRTPVFAFLEPRTVRLANILFRNPPVTPDFIGHNAALAISMVLFLFWNFFINRYWTYADIVSVDV
jgi:putative flippase GtrA